MATVIVTAGGRRLAVSVERDGGGVGVVRVRIDEETLDVGVDTQGPGTYRVRIGGRAETMHCVAEGAALHVFWRGRAYRLEREDPGKKRALAPPAGALEAPMPGRIVAIKVQAGDTVQRGQGLVIVEAMKMENVVRAPRDGHVKAVAVEMGARVTSGQILVELE